MSTQNSTELVWDQGLIDKYNISGPRYTSYPTALEFKEDFEHKDFVKAVEQSETNDLSIYIHIPFCHTLCYYCGCNKVITRHPEKADIYLNTLAEEIKTTAERFAHYTVSQIHLGGGTPTFLSNDQMSRLFELLRGNFKMAEQMEISVEIDPRRMTIDKLDHLHALGFNRVSIGVQDFSPIVQEAVNREQSEDIINALVYRAKELGIESVNLDLIYGLPFQNVASFNHTLEKVIKLDPNRLSVFNYAHMPNIFAAQRKLKDKDLPAAEEKMRLLRHTIETLGGAGYQYIGMDHFAKPENELAVAQRQGVLHRNFQGYTTHGNCDLLGMGVSSISQIGRAFSQNHKELKKYYATQAEAGTPLWRGLTLNDDDLLRRDVIKNIICNLQLNFADIEQQYNIDFDSYFRSSLEALVPMAYDGLLELNDSGLKVTSTGRLLLRNICMPFDAYFAGKRQQQFSKVI